MMHGPMNIRTKFMSTEYKQTVFLKMKNIWYKTAYVTLILNYKTAWRNYNESSRMLTLFLWALMEA